MKRFLLLAVILLSAPIQRAMAAEPAPASSPAAENLAGSVPSEARVAATAAARVLTKEGFRIREGEWGVFLAKATPLFLRVTLFAWEEYGFAAASAVPGTKLAITLFDAAGKEVKSEPCDTGGGSRTVVRIAPRKSGAYFVKLELLESPTTAPADTSLVYAYK